MSLVRATTVGGPEARSACEQTALRSRNDPAAFAEVYVGHRDAVFRFLRARCRSEDDALELTAVTFERALSAMPRYVSRGGGVRAWLLRIARNAAIDQSRRGRLLVPFWPIHRSAMASDRDEPEATAIRADEHRYMRSLVSALPDVQRDAIALRYGAGLTARDIAAVIDKSEEATQKLLARALARLKEAYRDER